MFEDGSSIFMLNIGVITLFPDTFKAVTDFGISRRACENGLLNLAFYNPRDYANDKHRTVDDRPFGGGPGMVMQIEPVAAAIAKAKQQIKGPVLAMSPQGKKLDQQKVAELAAGKEFIVLAGRYEGIDERVMNELVDEEISLGDFVLSGGEVAAMALVDACIRLVPEVLGHKQSAVEDSFTAGLLDHPHYTRPDKHELGDVPAVLLSGDHKKIEAWRLKQALGRTWLRRPDLLKAKELSKHERALLTEFIEEYLPQQAK